MEKKNNTILQSDEIPELKEEIQDSLEIIPETRGKTIMDLKKLYKKIEEAENLLTRLNEHRKIQEEETKSLGQKKNAIDQERKSLMEERNRLNNFQADLKRSYDSVNMNRDKEAFNMAAMIVPKTNFGFNRKQEDILNDIIKLIPKLKTNIFYNETLKVEQKESEKETV